MVLDPSPPPLQHILHISICTTSIHIYYTYLHTLHHTSWASTLDVYNVATHTTYIYMHYVNPHILHIFTRTTSYITGQHTRWHTYYKYLRAPPESTYTINIYKHGIEIYYGVATICRLLTIIRLFCRISSIL